MKRIFFAASLSFASAATLFGYFLVQYFLLGPDTADWALICCYFFYFLAAAVMGAHFLQRISAARPQATFGWPLFLPFATALLAVALVIPATGVHWYLQLLRHGTVDIPPFEKLPAEFRGLMTLKNVHLVQTESVALVGQTDDHSNYSAGAVYPVKDAENRVVALLKSPVHRARFTGAGVATAKNLPGENAIADISGMVRSDATSSATYAIHLSERARRNWKIHPEIRTLDYVPDKSDFVRKANKRGPLVIVAVLFGHWLICFLGLTLFSRRS